VQIELPIPQDATAPAYLKRFPWAGWLTVADAAARRGLTPQLTRAVTAARGNRRPPRHARQILGGKRPGRGGHPDSHYRQVAKRYQELHGQGRLDPTASLAVEYDTSRNTVAGWVRKARDRGYLPPARKGRAG
jgi:hypothetical protein